MKKTAVIAIVSLLLVACITGIIVWKVKDDKAKKELAALATIATIQEKVNALYKDNQKLNLADSINNEMIKNSQDVVAQLSEEGLSAKAAALFKQASLDLNTAVNMFALKQNIEKLFDKNGALVESADLKPFKDQLEALKTDKPAFVSDMMVKLNDAEAQKEKISTATKLVEGLFTSSEKSTVKENITRAEIDEAKAKVNEIKQDKAKESLLTSIQTTDAFLESKIKAEAEAKAVAEAKAKAEADAKAKAVADANKAKSNQSTASANKSNGTPDLTGWVPYNTGDPATLLKYLASGDVIKYNGKYYASPDLVDMISNENVVKVIEISK
ncbi:toxin Cry1Ac domain D-VI-related protein [Paenibacillus whitsoniae]|uniref:Pesticidal crystal protein Cry1Aa domain-containing protein n=1 Tax=Paenibacillus whitsoniae TaxID=2496558 RepID=A0A3S0BMP8_9BACL|nr:toxin Cry1Ac domain D-VI-related protein [Paenibacillus whitsoniae]RTE10033.1 hypothetical protein EJQ19_09135 [Paenibacillus whitsoniae]